MAKVDCSFDDNDVRAVVKLLGLVSGMKSETQVRRRRLAEALADLVQADRWLWVLVKDDPATDELTGFWAIDGGWPEAHAEKRALFQLGAVSPEARIVNDHFKQKTPRHRTETREDWFPLAEWEKSPLVKNFFKPAGITEMMASVYPIGNQTVSSMTLFRENGRPPFDARERALVHLVLGQIDWLHRAESNVPVTEHIRLLTPRQRQVMFMLLEGSNRKHIARVLRISAHTAAEHIGAVYRNVGVNSQSELMAQFFVRMPGKK